MVHSIKLCALALLLLAAPARAESATQDTADAVIDRIVEDAKVGENGTMVPATGAAQPAENWFGCAKGSDADHCAQDDRTEQPAED